MTADSQDQSHEGNCLQELAMSPPFCSIDPEFAMPAIPCTSLAHDNSLEGFDLLKFADCCKDSSIPNEHQESRCWLSVGTVPECADTLTSASGAVVDEGHWTKIKELKKANQQSCRADFWEVNMKDTSSNDPVVPRRDDTEPRRPKNGFLRFSNKYRSEIAKRHPRMDNRNISRILGSRWRKMTAEEKQPYEQEFTQDIQEIRDKNPRWRYAPAHYFQEELVDPMSKRLRPKDKLKQKEYQDYSCAWRPYKRRSRSEKSLRRDSAFTTSTKLCTWDSRKACTDHHEVVDLLQKWYCHKNQDAQFCDQLSEKDQHGCSRVMPHLFHIYPCQSTITAATTASTNHIVL